MTATELVTDLLTAFKFEVNLQVCFFKHEPLFRLIQPDFFLPETLRPLRLCFFKHKKLATVIKLMSDAAFKFEVSLQVFFFSHSIPIRKIQPYFFLPETLHPLRLYSFRLK